LALVATLSFLFISKVSLSQELSATSPVDIASPSSSSVSAVSNFFSTSTYSFPSTVL